VEDTHHGVSGERPERVKGIGKHGFTLEKGAPRRRTEEEELGDSVEEALVELLGSAVRAAGKALGGIFSALVLEANLEPDVLTERKLRALLGTSLDALLGLGIKKKT
jgi:hypothetical protein